MGKKERSLILSSTRVSADTHGSADTEVRKRRPYPVIGTVRGSQGGGRRGGGHRRATQVRWILIV